MKILYTTVESVKVRLSGKVQFQTQDPPLDGELSDDLLYQFIHDAETHVEQDLRSRYEIPFRSASKGSFSELPDHTKRAIRTVVDYRCMMEVLPIDFGRGTHISGESYYESVKSKYDMAILRLLGRDSIATNDKIDRYKLSPPLEDLQLAKHNLHADDGYRGMIINTDASQNDATSYAEKSINNPSKSYIRKRGFGGL